MSTASMLPPKMPVHSGVLHATSTSPHHPKSGNNHSDLENSLKYEDTTIPANLTQDSMMMLSQSVDSLHTLATNEGVEEAGHQVRTVFVSGLPLDAKPRELYLLFRGFKGYQSSTLKPAGKNGKLTAPVGFVTFESREQAEEAMTKLQGVRFDPDGNQHMRLEFARTNTKVTKPKFLAPGAFTNGPASAVTAGAVPAGLGAHGCPATLVAGGLSGLMAGIQPSLFSHLANTGASSPFENSSALFATPDALAAAAAAQWTPSIASAYDNASYLASAAGLLQANNFRAIIPGNLNSSGFNFPIGATATSTTPNLQMFQAAILQANAAAAAALGSSGPTSVTNCSGPILSASPHQTVAHQQLSPVSIAGSSAAGVPSSSPLSVSRSSPVTASRGAVQTAVAGNFGPFQSPAQSQMHTYVAQLHQQQQQTIAAVQLGQQQQQQHTSFSQAQQQQQPVGYASQPTGFPNQMTAAAAIGLLGGYNSLVKELTGGEAAQLHSGLQAYQQNNGY